jgi:hypothetical protein
MLLSASPTLPPEIWGEIFTHVENLDLWWSCRNVSHIHRREAEREFALHRLHQIHIGWMFHISNACDAGTYDGTYDGYLESKGSLARFSEDGNKANFYFTIFCEYSPEDDEGD